MTRPPVTFFKRADYFGSFSVHGGCDNHFLSFVTPVSNLFFTFCTGVLLIYGKMVCWEIYFWENHIFLTKFWTLDTKMDCFTRCLRRHNFKNLTELFLCFEMFICAYTQKKSDKNSDWQIFFIFFIFLRSLDCEKDWNTQQILHEESRLFPVSDLLCFKVFQTWIQQSVTCFFFFFLFFYTLI